MTTLAALKRDVAILHKALNPQEKESWQKQAEITKAILWCIDAITEYSQACNPDSNGHSDYNSPEAIAANIELGKAIANYQKVDPDGNLFALAEKEVNDFHDKRDTQLEP